MREIKFRAWDKQKKVMIYFDDLEITNTGGFWGGTREVWSMQLYCGIGSCDEGGYWHGDFATRCELELMQYTGLKDRNNKEIYEGDIISFTGYDLSNEGRYGYSNGFNYKITAIVKFIPSKGFCLKFISKINTDDDNEILPIPCGYGYITQSRSIKLGNIYENKDLLDGKH